MGLPIVGGNVPPSQVVGRDAFIRKLWATLENGSVVLVSERRIGKTSIIRKMAAEPLSGWQPFYMAIESKRSPAAFIQAIYDAVKPILTKGGKLVGLYHELLQKFGGQKVALMEVPQGKDVWQQMLKAILSDIKEHAENRVLFLWDELPLMIDNIKKDMGPTVAMELLDTLRDHRLNDDSGRIRMVYTGSIGLHLVISELQERGYLGDPTNDMASFSLGGLSDQDACTLARKGLDDMVQDNFLELAVPSDEVALTISQNTDGLPFYINHTVSQLGECNRPVGKAEAEEAIEYLLFASNDPAHFRHYHDRIRNYYNFHPQAKDIAFGILGALCRADAALSEDDLWDAVTAKVELTDRWPLQRVLEVLLTDHYLSREGLRAPRRYRFKYSIIKRWWANNRG